jgi:hypothetical protein
MRPIGNETGAAMSSTAMRLRHEYGAARQSSPAAGWRLSDEAATVSARLMSYWRDTLPLPVATRRRALDVVCARARRDAAVVSDVLPFALGDPDEEVVYRATLAHVGAYPPHGTAPAAAADAIEWVRRRLAVNCAAVFAALLSLGDERVLDALLPLRSVLGAEEAAAVRRRVGSACPAPARAFLETWVELTDQSTAGRR